MTILPKGELISRADAIEAVAQEWLSEASAESPYVNDDDIGEYKKLAEKLFEDVPSAEAEWIPCSERLPSEIGTIIVTLLDKKYGECFVDDEWWDGDMFLNFGKPTSGYEVIAWMPYPMPYRKGDER